MRKVTIGIIALLVLVMSLVPIVLAEKEPKNPNYNERSGDVGYGVEMSCDDLNHSTTPGNSTTFEVQIKNIGTLNDTYEITAGSIEDIVCNVNGINADQFTPYLISLRAGASTTFNVSTEVGESVPEEEWTVVVSAYSQNDTNVYDELYLTVGVNGEITNNSNNSVEVYIELLSIRSDKKISGGHIEMLNLKTNELFIAETGSEYFATLMVPQGKYIVTGSAPDFGKAEGEFAIFDCEKFKIELVLVSDEQNGTDESWKYQNRDEIREGIDNEFVGAEMTIIKKKEIVSANIIAYRSGMELEIKDISKNRINIIIRANFSEGKVIVLNIAHTALEIPNVNNCTIKFDGKTAELSNVKTVLSANGEKAIYCLTIGNNGTQALIYIPQFSEHLVTVETMSVTSTISESDKVVGTVSVIAIIAGIVTVLILVLNIIRSGRQKD